jgi:hypothetical protein
VVQFVPVEPSGHSVPPSAPPPLDEDVLEPDDAVVPDELLLDDVLPEEDELEVDDVEDAPVLLLVDDEALVLDDALLADDEALVLDDALLADDEALVLDDALLVDDEALVLDDALLLVDDDALDEELGPPPPSPPLPAWLAPPAHAALMEATKPRMAAIHAFRVIVRIFKAHSPVHVQATNIVRRAPSRAPRRFRHGGPTVAHARFPWLPALRATEGVTSDGELQCVPGDEGAAGEHAALQDREGAFDLVQPGRVLRREAPGPARMLFEPGEDVVAAAKVAYDRENGTGWVRRNPERVPGFVPAFATRADISLL